MRQMARATGVAGLVFVIVFAFQNCSKGFSGTSADLSVQCVQKVQLEKMSFLKEAGQLHCEAMDRYRCEVRSFSPAVETGEIQGQTCASVNGEPFCVSLITRNFNTAAGRSLQDLDATAYAVGGEFNRQEINCAYVEDQFGVLRAEAASPQVALEQVVSACLAAQAQGAEL